MHGKEYLLQIEGSVTQETFDGIYIGRGRGEDILPTFLLLYNI